MPRELHLSAALDGAGHHPAGPVPPPDAAQPPPAAHWIALAALAERGALDFVTLHDSLAPPPEGHPGRLDAVAVLARTAPATSRIGLVPTVTTTHTEPFHTSTAIATLDFVSEGRAGWLAEVSATEAEARAVGRRGPAPAAALWAEASDAAEVAGRLWDSWEDDAEIRDAATGRFVDRDRLHHIDFRGPHFSVRGPSIVPRPPQGRPPVAVVLGPEDPTERWAFAAAHADLVLLDAPDPRTARTARDDLRRRSAAAGRDPDRLRLLVRTAVALTGPAPAADAGAGPRASGGHPDPPATGGPAGAREYRTVHHTGTAADLAELLAHWQADTAADGFVLVPHLTPGGLDEFVDRVVPLLQERGAFRAEYEGPTLRHHLGLPAPRPSRPTGGPA
ncbi:LLM class flavin-dependent oxidoreductase [Streptomyces sp. NPDC018031]|uniref:LLM class flavin-dependent oxidoreductase n=1 Tax=Streptomyces sp. NPDC018031 TaxID=3365033 RepID=UPI0037B5B3EB